MEDREEVFDSLPAVYNPEVEQFDDIEELEAEEVVQEEQFDELILDEKPIKIDVSYFEKQDGQGGGGASGAPSFNPQDLEPDPDPQWSGERPQGPPPEDDSPIDSLVGNDIKEQGSERFTVRNKNRFS